MHPLFLSPKMLLMKPKADVDQGVMISEIKDDHAEAVDQNEFVQNLIRKS
jgi:hypothetical protein